MPTGTPYPWYLTSESIDEVHNRVVDFVEGFRAKHEWGPTVDEIARGTGAKVNTVRQMVDRLLRSGYLIRPGGKATSFARTLRKTTDDEKREALLQGWLHKLRALPIEERQAAMMAAEKLRQDSRNDFGEEAGAA